MSERERFEQFMRDHALDDKIHFARRDDGTYAYPGMSTLWQGWQARARIAEQEKQRLVELVEAVWQVLDDMGKDGLCCCLVAKAQLRVAYEFFDDGEAPPDMTFEEARALLTEHEGE